MRRTRLSLVMPAFNEVEGIAEAVGSAHEALLGLGYEFEIIVVDDGSTDGTAGVVAELAAVRPQVRLISHARNRGYGAALRTGFEAAVYERVAFTDADGQFDLRDLELLVAYSEDYPIVVGRRLARQDPWRRRFLSWGYNRLVRLFLRTGLRDVDCALKVFRRPELDWLLPESAGFFVNTEMIARARQFGWPIAEVGVRHQPRRRGVSKVSLREVPRVFKTLLHFWWRNVVLGRVPAAPRLDSSRVLPLPPRRPMPARRAA